jgi:hypothetical protein
MTKNMAKCALCGDTIESLTQFDVVECSCGEISIWGGEYELRCHAKNFKNFLRIDADGSERQVKYIDVTKTDESNESDKPIPESLTREELIDELDTLIKYIGNYPPHKLYSPCSYADLRDFCSLISSVLKFPLP